MMLFKILNACIISCIWNVGASSQFLSTINWDNWTHLHSRDLERIAIDNFEDHPSECPLVSCAGQINKLENTTASVLPSENIAEDPLNKYIGVDELHASIVHALTANLPDKAIPMSDGVGGNVLSLVNDILKHVKPSLEEAVTKRLENLLTLEKERINKKLSSSKENIEIILNEAIAKSNDKENIWQSFVQGVKSSHLSPEVKKVLSYHIVREEMTLAQSNFQGSEKEFLPTLIETIMPFLTEGVTNEDHRIVNENSDEVARNELENKLIPLYKSFIEEGLLDAKALDNFFTEQSKFDPNFIDTIVEDAYTKYIRRATSIYLYYAFRIFPNYEGFDLKSYTNCTRVLNTDNINHIVEYVAGGKTHWMHIQHEFKLRLVKVVDEKFMRRAIGNTPVLDFWIKTLVEKYVIAIQKNCEAHLKQHDEFTEDHKSEMAANIKKLLETKYNDIQEPEINILKTQFKDHDTFFKLSKYSLNLPEKLLEFQEDIGKKAETFGFAPGQFVYSGSYFDVLERIFSEKQHSKPDASGVKSEL